MVDTSRPTENPATRERIPFNNFTKKLEVHGDIPGYHLYWFNDDGERIPRAQAGGYDFVKRKELALNGGVTDGNSALDDKVRRICGKHPNGEAMYAYLMKIPEDLWKADQEALGQINRNIERAIRGGTIGNAEAQHSYTDGTPMTGKGVKYDPAPKQPAGTPARPLAKPQP